MYFFWGGGTIPLYIQLYIPHLYDDCPIKRKCTVDDSQFSFHFHFFSVQDLFIYKKDILQILQIMEVVQHQSETGQKINNHNKDGLSQVATFPDNLRVCHQRGHPKSLI